MILKKEDFPVILRKGRHSCALEKGKIYLLT